MYVCKNKEDKIVETTNYILYIDAYYQIWSGRSDFINKQTDYELSINPSFEIDLTFDPILFYQIFAASIKDELSFDFDTSIYDDKETLMHQLEKAKERIGFEYVLDEENKVVKFIYTDKNSKMLILDENNEFVSPSAKFAYKYQLME